MRDMLRLNVGMRSTDGMGIGAVAARFGLATHVLRHWESVGLLSPERVGDRRRYGPDDLYRVAVILRAKEAGLALEDIRRLIAARDPAARRATLERHHSDLTRRIARARASLEMVESALACTHEDLTECPHFRSVVTRRAEEKATCGQGDMNDVVWRRSLES
ncbi:MerR family transcriptional regulator [Actinoallomurus iriomotensis]|uniref:HTH merR-type domain-containing protein n=1 Tax=Actinoallomurus iriomotensis TaxID=478107 RepID=A0A9W6W587_9ACTN|nr:MerR family transcriptional regulator [Actinoallomurus iriomotensis]GLY91805.1 hypothetical protein Airi02_097330 [Actinoallomurus iriomotensis]